ncbi:MAG: hypothetical protein GQ548_04295 [Methylophaga sp.]|nr:hypothetical protein [Methylophaga sp.]
MNKDTDVASVKWNLSELMLAVLFLIAPFYHHPNIGGAGLNVPNNITVWFVATILVCWSLYKVAKRKEIVLPKNYFYILMFPILVTISGLLAGVVEPITWLFRLLFIWGGILFFFSLFQSQINQKRIIFIIIVSALLHSIIGMIVIFNPEMKISFIPMPIPLSPSGFFQQINNQASFQVTAIALAAYLITTTYIIKGNIWKKMIIFIFFFCSSFIISYSGSRVGMLSFCLVLPLAILAGWRTFKIEYKSALISLVFIVSGFILGNVGLGSETNKISKITHEYTQQEGRVGIYALSLVLAKEQVILGHGIGSFESVWQYNKPAFRSQYPEIELTDQYITHPHNELIFWAVEGGLLSVLGILIFLIVIAKSVLKHKFSEKIAYITFLLPIILHTQVELPFYTSAVHWFLFMTIAYIIMDNSTHSVSLLNSSKLQAVKLFSLITLFFSSLFFGQTLNYSYLIGMNEIKKVFSESIFINPYFLEHLERVQMNAILINMHNTKQFENMPLYINWATDYIQKRPAPEMLDYLAMAYHDIEQNSNMCDVLRIAKSIYPTKESFQLIYMEKC